MDVSVRVQVDDPSAVGAARRAAASLAREDGLDETASGRAQLVATELAGNLQRHARSGEVLLRRLGAPEGGGVEVLAVDRGPGIADVARALRDGFSTGGTPGTGLGAVRRSAATFDLHTRGGSGTAVLARVGGRGPASPAPAAIGAVCLPLEGERECGDAWTARAQGATVRVAVADGIGHGAAAAEAARRAMDVVETAGDLPLERLMERVHAALAGTRGAAVSIADLDLPGERLRFTGVGNVAGAVIASGARRGLATTPGTVGKAMRSAVALEYPFPRGALLVMHSDGCRTGWALDAEPGVLRRHPSVVAGLLWRDWGRPRDDVTVVAVRRAEAGA